MNSLADAIAKARGARPPHVRNLLEPPAVARPNADAYVHDFFAPLNSTALTADDVRRINTPCAAVALHGFLPPATIALAAPREYRGALVNYYLNQQAQWVGLAFGPAQTTAVIPLPPGVFVLYPGDVVPLGRVAPDGVDVVVSSGPFNQDTVSTTRARFGARPEAYVRVFSTVEGLPARIGYNPIPSYTLITPDTVTPPTNADLLGVATGGAALLYGATHVRVTFQDNVTGQTSIQGVESGSYEIWWLDASGVWAHHDDDDFDAAGRGTASASHTSEVYSVHPGVLAIYIARTAGNTFSANVTAFDAYGGHRR